MKIDSDILGYLSDDKFSDSITFNITRSKQLPVTRELSIVETTRGSSVIHLGCADHAGLIDDKIKTNKWLHKLLTENSSSCLGIDISREGIDHMREKLGYTNVLRADILTDNIEDITLRNWDWVVFGELIEHLNNPVEFLSVFRKRFGSGIKKFLISVPSVYNTRQINNLKNYREVINSDHRYWFTPYTITKILVAAGYRPEEMTFVNLQSLNTISLIKRKLLRIAGIHAKYPYYNFNTIIVTGYLQ